MEGLKRDGAHARQDVTLSTLCHVWTDYHVCNKPATHGRIASTAYVWGRDVATYLGLTQHISVGEISR